MSSKSDEESMLKAVSEGEIQRCATLLSTDKTLVNSADEVRTLPGVRVHKNYPLKSPVSGTLSHLSPTLSLSLSGCCSLFSSKHGEAALMIATYKNHLDVATVLVDQGADLDAKDEVFGFRLEIAGWDLVTR